MDLGTIIGFISGTIFLILSFLISAAFDVSKVLKIADGPSAMIVFGGSIAALLIAYPVPKIINGVKQIGKTFKPPIFEPTKAIQDIITYANIARKEGLLSLEDYAEQMDDPFMKKGIMLIVDGTDAELIKNILETEMGFIEERHKEVIGVWDFIGAVGPAFGMIGTLIGLIMMLQDMSDPDQLGPNMAIALITTFYGALMSNFVTTPVATKLKLISGDEMLVKEIQTEGMLSILAGENPRIIEEKLKSFLSPVLRNSISDLGGESVG